MAINKASEHEVMKGAGRVSEHIGAVILGFLMMVGGLAMGVTMVMLPVGIVVGFLGLLAFLWGVFVHEG